MTRPTLHLPQIPEPEGLIFTCEGPGMPVTVTLYRGGVCHKINISAVKAVQGSRELLAAGLHSGITERTPNE